MALGENSDLGLGQETYKISLEYVVVARSKKVLQNNNNKIYNVGGIPKRSACNDQNWNNLSNKTK